MAEDSIFKILLGLAYEQMKNNKPTVGSHTEQERETLAEEFASKALRELLSRPELLQPLSLPKVAPALWLEREDRKQSPTDFIKLHYGPWLGKGLTQAHIRNLDRSLYMALHKWLKSNELDIELPTKKEMHDTLLAGGEDVFEQLDDLSRMRLRNVARSRRFRMG